MPRDDQAGQPIFFATPEEFRTWLEEHHAVATEIVVGFHKKGTGLPSITWPESVEQALCFGWIDGVRRSLGETSYTVRFTPRAPRSTWSAANIALARSLVERGLMRPAGLAAFESRADDRSAIYSYERRRAPELGDDLEQRFRAHAVAWEWFQKQPPGYRRSATYWVVSAKREETRLRRLAQLIEDCAAGRPIRPLARPASRDA